MSKHDEAFKHCGDALDIVCRLSPGDGERILRAVSEKAKRWDRHEKKRQAYFRAFGGIGLPPEEESRIRELGGQFIVDTAKGKLSGDELVGYISQLETKNAKMMVMGQALYEMCGGTGLIDDFTDVRLRVQNWAEEMKQECGMQTARGPLRGNDLAGYIRMLEENAIARKVEVDRDDIIEIIEETVWSIHTCDCPSGVGVYVKKEL